MKVHVHTDDPGKAIQYACELGELVNLKIDNMAEERRERLKKAEADQKAAAEKQQQEEAAKAEQPLKEYGMVAVSLGEGFSGIFGDLGVDHIVEGGQTMNPSIEDILDAVEKVGAKNVFVLPNNSNVILAASQAAELSERNVIRSADEERRDGHRRGRRVQPGGECGGKPRGHDRRRRTGENRADHLRCPRYGVRG